MLGPGASVFRRDPRTSVRMRRRRVQVPAPPEGQAFVRNVAVTREASSAIGDGAGLHFTVAKLLERAAYLGAIPQMSLAGWGLG